MRLLVLVHVYHTTNTSINNCVKQQLHHVKLLLTAKCALKSLVSTKHCMAKTYQNLKNV